MPPATTRPRLRGVSAAIMLLAAAPLASGAQGPDDLFPTGEVPEVVRTVYLDLVRQFGDARTPPHLSMGDTRMALSYNPRTHVVELSWRIYEAVGELGDDAPDALAYLLGHELAHFYADHVFGRDYGRLFADLRSTAAVTRPTEESLVALFRERAESAGSDVELSDEALRFVARVSLELERAERSIEREAQSDFLAGFKAYLAGYDVMGVAPRVLDRLYADLGLAAGAFRSHPPRDDRIRILETVSAELERMILGFEGGVRLTVIGAHPLAGRLFEHIAESFPSREIVSNAGVARAMEALEILGDDVPWLLPFEVDLQTRLRGRYRRGRGGSPAEVERARALLEEARALFERARTLDPGYVPAYVNLAAVNAALGRIGFAVAYAEEAETLAEEEGEAVAAAHARAVHGVALALRGEREAAESRLLGAADAARRLAAHNLAVLRGESPPTSARPSPGGEITECEDAPGGACPDEAIGGIAVAGPGVPALFREPHALSLEVRGQGDAGPITVVAERTDDVDGYLFHTDDRGPLVVLSTPDDYGGESGRGIRIDTPATGVSARYGEPGRVVPARQGEYWVYDDTAIAFLVDEAGAVASWMVWGWP